MEEDEKKEWEDILEQARDIQNALKLESIDTALLMMISSDVDQIRYNNC